MRHEEKESKPICSCESSNSLNPNGFRSTSASVSSGSSLGESLISSSYTENSLSERLKSASISDISVLHANLQDELASKLTQRLHASAECLLNYEEDEKQFFVARVYFRDSKSSLQYKSMKIFSTSRACDVISMTLRKFHTADEATEYSLYQILDNKKTYHIPMNSNMYTGMQKCKKDICFKVSKKKTSKKWLNSDTAKLSSFHRKMRKTPLDTEGYGIMFQPFP